MIIKLLLLLTVGMPSVLLAQKISGRVVDSENAEPIPYASVYITNIQVGTITDSTGFFQFNIELPQSNELRVSAELYRTVLIQVSSSDRDLVIKLDPTHLDMEDVVVSSPRGGLTGNNVFKIDRLDLKDLNSIQSSNLSEAISNINGVQVASLGAGISKPVIRGMQGLRVLTLVNGVRLNNQQWGGDHGLGISELGIGSVELIKGPSSLLYGSDALGGVIYLVDAPYPSIGKQQLAVSSNFESVNLGTSNSINYGLSKGNFRFNLGGMISSYADYKLPNGYFLENSRYRQEGGKAAISYLKKNWVSHFRYLYSKVTTGIPGHVHDSIIDPSDFQSTDQIREREIPYQRNVLNLASWESKFFLNKNEIQAIISYSRNDLIEFEEKYTIPGIHLLLHNTTASFRFTHVLNESIKFVYGYQGVFQMNKNDPKAEELLIPEFIQLDNGLYGIGYIKAGKFDLQFGGRIDHRFLSAASDSLRNDYFAPNFSFGFVRGISKNVIRFNISSGYRAPHVSELLSDGVHHAALRYEIGDRELKSEYGIQLDLDYEWQGEHISLVINPFYNYLLNYISLTRTDSIIDGLPVLNYTEFKEVSLFGADLGVHYHPHFAHFLHLESTYSYVRGHDRVGASLDLIPQARLNTLIKIMIEGKIGRVLENFVLQHQYYFRQDRTGIAETSSIDYHLINIAFNGKIGKKHQFDWTVGVKNALDQTYINHLSRLKNINMPNEGRNVFIGIKYSIPSF